MRANWKLLLAAALFIAALALPRYTAASLLLSAWIIFCLVPALLILPLQRLPAGLALASLAFMLLGFISHIAAVASSLLMLLAIRLLPIPLKLELRAMVKPQRAVGVRPPIREGRELPSVPSVSHLVAYWKPSLSIIGESLPHAIKLLERLILPLTEGLRRPMVVIDFTGMVSGLTALRQAAGRVKVIDGRLVDFTCYEPLDKLSFIRAFSSLLGDVDVDAARVAIEDGLTSFLEASRRESTLKSIAEAQSTLGCSPLEDLLELSKVNVIDLSMIVDFNLRGVIQRLIDLQLYRLARMGLIAPVAHPLPLQLPQRSREIMRATLMEVLSGIEEGAGLVIALSAYSDLEFAGLTRDMLVSVRSAPSSLSRMLESMKGGLSRELAYLSIWEALYVTREPSGLKAYRVSLPAGLSMLPQPAVYAQPARVKAVIGALKALGRRELKAAVRLMVKAREAAIPESEVRSLVQVRKPMRVLNLLVELGVLDWDLVFTERGEPMAVFKPTPLTEAVLRELLPEESYSL